MIHQFAIRPVGGGGGATASVKISAGTLSALRTDVTFSNSNGVSFGLNAAGVLTATVQTNYLTTAMASNRGSDFVQATAAFAGTNASGTINSTGISVSVAAQSVASINISAGTTSNNLTAVTFSNSNNVSFGINASTVTASIATTYAGTGFTTATTAGTNIVGTLNTSGLSLGVPAYLTTAALSQDSSKYAGTNFATTTSAGTAIAGTLNTSGLTLGVPPFLTTAMQSNAATISNINISAGTTSTNASAFTFSNSNNFSFGLGTGASAGVITASYTVPTVTNSSLTLSDAVTSMTIGRLAFTNSNGLTLTLSTAAGGSATLIGSYSQSGQAFSAGGGSSTFSTLSFSNANGVSFTNTNGQVAASIATSLTNINVSAGTTSTNASAFTFSNGSNVSFGLGTGASAGVITASVATSLTNINISAGTTSNNLSAVTFSNSNDISFGLSGSTITASYQGFQSYWYNTGLVASTVTQTITAQLQYIAPFCLPYYVSASYLRLGAFLSALTATFGTTANTTFSASIVTTYNAVVYSLGTGASSNSLQSVVSGSASIAQQYSWQAGNTGSNWTLSGRITYPITGGTSSFSSTDAETVTNFSMNPSAFLTSNFTGIRYLDIPFANSLKPGPYWLAVGYSTATSTQGNAAATGNMLTLSHLMLYQGNFGMGDMGGSIPASQMFEVGAGFFSTNSQTVISALDLTLISRQANVPLWWMQFIRRA